MVHVSISDFRAHLPDFLNRVEAGETLVITSRGKEIARVLPPKEAQKQARKQLAELKKNAVIGDVISPVAKNRKTKIGASKA